MIEALRHRGPDDTGFYIDAGIGLANARLSIIDIEGGHQPIHNEDGTIHVTYNGEIYNFRELRKQLESLGHRFYTQSDTEVIVHSYEQFGDSFVAKLNGMFAIALWDSKKQRLLLARDRMGIKPLYYTLWNGGLLFASEIKSILQAPLRREVDQAALFAILNVGYIPGEITLLKGIRKLPPSTSLVWENGSTRTAQYWQIPPSNQTLTEEQVVPQLQAVLEETVRDQLVADVPVGCFLSGGLDSVTGGARMFYRINSRTYYGTIADLFELTHAKATLREGGRIWVAPKDQVQVLTSSTLDQRSAEVAWGRVHALYRHRTNKAVYEIRLRGGRRIRVTGDHSVFKVRSAHRGLVGDLVRADLLRRGDRLFVATNVKIEGDESVDSDSPRLSMLTLAGLYTADGSLSRDGRHLAIAAGNDRYVTSFIKELGQERILKELNLTDKIALALQRKGYSNQIVQELASKYHCSPQLVYTAKSRKLHRRIPRARHRFATYVTAKGDVHIGSRRIANWIRSQGFAGDSRSKRVPPWLIAADESQIAAFLRGYFSGDGSVYKIKERTVVSCESVNWKLIEAVQTLLLRLGIYSVISKKKPGESSYPGSTEFYSLTIGRIKSLGRFRHKIGFIQRNRLKLLSSLKGGRKAYSFTSATIQSIKRLSTKERTVYDLQVEGTQRFIANGILCHNTSTIVAFASKASSRPLRTFCMGFGEDTDEFRDARIVAELFGTEHQELVVDSALGMKLYPKMLWHMEAPKYNLYPWFVCELVRKHVKVCLSGNGGDEMFGGYFARYQNALEISKIAQNPVAPLLRSTANLLQSLPSNTKTKNRLRALEALGDQAEEYVILAGGLPDSFSRQLFKAGVNVSLRDYYSPFFKSKDFLEGLMNAELRTKLVDDLLSVDDTMSMAHSLELRVPLLDNRIVDLMASVPWRMKYHAGTFGKTQLRKVVEGILPAESLRKPKWGFSVNVSYWFKGELGELVGQILPESDVVRKYFSSEMVRRMVTKPYSTRDRRNHVLLWQLLGFHFWHRIFIDAEKIGTIPLEVNALVA